MGLESATYISDLIATNPTGSDPASSSDDHHRLVKSVLKTTFPNLNGAVTATPAQLNSVTGKADRAGDAFTGTVRMPKMEIGDGGAYIVQSANNVQQSMSGESWLWTYARATGRLTWFRNNGITASTVFHEDGSVYSGGPLYAGVFGDTQYRLEKTGNFSNIYFHGNSLLQYNIASGAIAFYLNGAFRFGHNENNHFVVASLAFKPGGGSWSDTSDERVKENFRPYTIGLTEILQLNPETWNFRVETGRDPAIRYAGVRAQNAENLIPGMVRSGPGKMGSMEFPDLRSVDPSEMVWALTNAVKTLNQMVATLQTRVAALEAAA